MNKTKPKSIYNEGSITQKSCYLRSLQCSVPQYSAVLSPLGNKDTEQTLLQFLNA